MKEGCEMRCGSSVAAALVYTIFLLPYVCYHHEPSHIYDGSHTLDVWPDSSRLRRRGGAGRDGTGWDGTVQHGIGWILGDLGSRLALAGRATSNISMYLLCHQLETLHTYLPRYLSTYRHDIYIYIHIEYLLHSPQKSIGCSSS